MLRIEVRIWAIPLAFVLGAAGLTAQSSMSDKPASNKQAAVSYLFPEQVTIAADKPTAVDLHFKVAAGLHVNSHTPHTEELIPTTLKIPETSGVRLVSATFPPGADYAFAINPGEKLSVYTGEFVIHTTLVAARGNHLVEATLRYQACNNESCFPPRTIPVAIDVISK